MNLSSCKLDVLSNTTSIKTAIPWCKAMLVPEPDSLGRNVTGDGGGGKKGKEGEEEERTVSVGRAIAAPNTPTHQHPTHHKKANNNNTNRSSAYLVPGLILLEIL